MNRIDQKFRTLKENHQKAFISFLTAGHPSIEQTKKLIKMKAKNNVDIIEIGIPFSDPLADGPVIQNSSTKALANGISVNEIFKMVEDLRNDIDIPLVFMTYFNIIYNYGIQAFVKRSKAIGIDGLIIPDLPYEEEHEITQYLEDDQLYLIPLLSPTSEKRIEKNVKNKSGFIYYVSSTGVTGSRTNAYETIEEQVDKIRKFTDLPIAVGFGIKTSEDVKAIQRFADGSVVGSRIVQTIEESDGSIEQVEQVINKLII